jgi:hypothetical protein
MAEYIFNYRAPVDYAPRAESMTAWTAWLEGMGAQLSDVGKPVFTGATVGNCGDGTRLGGYSLVTAENLDEALTLAKGCPLVAVGGGVDVGELTDLAALRAGQDAS